MSNTVSPVSTKQNQEQQTKNLPGFLPQNKREVIYTGIGGIISGLLIGGIMLITKIASGGKHNTTTQDK